MRQEFTLSNQILSKKIYYLFHLRLNHGISFCSVYLYFDFSNKVNNYILSFFFLSKLTFTMSNKKKSTEKFGYRFGRPDIERCDIFADCGFLNWGLYTGKPIIHHESSKKGAQMYSSVPSGGHKKCGLWSASGYFEQKFKTIAVNEPYLEKWRILGRPPAHPRKGPWIPSSSSKKHSTPGDVYGTFTTFADAKAFSPILRRTKKKEKELMNFLTNPGKKGTYGYVDVCINKYPPHSLDEREDKFTYAQTLYTKNWKAHKEKILYGPLRAGFFPRPYFNENPYRDSKIGPTYVQRPPKIYGVSRGLFRPPGFPKKPGNNHDGCFDKFPAWTKEPYKTKHEVDKELATDDKPGLVFRPEPRLKSYYIKSVVSNKIDTACNARTWRTMKPVTYPQFNL